jgi:hypothetical protein
MPNLQNLANMANMMNMQGGGQRGQFTQTHGAPMVNLQGIINDVQGILSHITSQHPNLLNMNGMFSGGQDHQTYQFHGNGHNTQFFFSNGMGGSSNAYQDPQYEFQEYGEEDDVDEDGQPIPSAEEVKDIINGIQCFKYEEEKQGSGREKESNRVSCAICLDDLKTGDMVKSLPCHHKFHSKCINSWLKQKLKCPLCKERITFPMV